MPLKDDSSYNYFGNDKPKCPHCDAVYNIGENDAYFLYNEDDSHEIECPECEKNFNVTSSCKWTFNTDEQD